jgi:hypothetical protein
VTYPTITEKYGSLSATGFAKETTFGTPVAADTFLPMVSNTMEENPGWFSPHLMQNLRDLQVYNLYGEAKFQGTIHGPIFPSNAMEVMVAAIGADSITGWGVYGTIATPSSTTLATSPAAGATSFDVTSATGFAVGQEVIVGSGLSNQEARLISNVSGTTITVADALFHPHTSGETTVSGTSTTTTSPSIVGATTIDVASATGIVDGTTLIQIDVNTVSGTKTSEVRKVTNTATLTLTLDSALDFAHASGAQVTIVTTPYTHTISEQNTLPSLTVEKNIGGFQSLQFAGCRVGKFDLKAPVGNTAVDLSIEMVGRSVTPLDSPTAVSVVNELPYVFAEANLNIFNTLRTEVSSTSIAIDNGLKETYTYSNFHGPSFITPVTLHTNGAIDLVFDSLNDSTYGDFNRMANGTLGSLLFSLIHPSSGGTITVFLPQIVLDKYANDIKMEDVVMSNLSYEATRPLSGSTQFTIQATVTNTVYLPY